MTTNKHHGHRRRKRGPERKHGPKREHIEELHPVEEPPKIEGFDHWPLDEEVLRAIQNMDIEIPTPIQALSIGPVLEGKDVIAKAETGTGKTLAFAAPMMSKVDPSRSTVLGLVLCPTRELAQQVANVVYALGLPRGLRVALVVGGDPMHEQIADLQKGAQVVVGTPGRVLDLYQQRFLQFPWTEFVILDEADKMFEIGFLDDIKKILSFTPPERQTLLFSATFPTEVLKLARESTRDPVEVATSRGTATVDTIEQFYLECDADDRPYVLKRLLDRSKTEDVFLVFCERRTDVDKLQRRLERLPYGIKALHGGYDQASRFRVMGAFRTGEVKVLLATDVAARGLDVEHVTHVINFGVPRELEDYTHRIGRTGRAGRHGTAITFVTSLDRRRWQQLVQRAPWEIPLLEEDDGRTRSRGGRERDEGRGRGSRERGERGSRDRGERGSRERGERGSRNRGERGSRDRGERDSRDRGERGDRGPREQGEREARGREEPRRGGSSGRTERGTRKRDESREQPKRSERGERPRREDKKRDDAAGRDQRKPPRREERDAPSAPPAFGHVADEGGDRGREEGGEERRPRRRGGRSGAGRGRGNRGS